MDRFPWAYGELPRALPSGISPVLPPIGVSPFPFAFLPLCGSCFFSSQGQRSLISSRKGSIHLFNIMGREAPRLLQEMQGWQDPTGRQARGDLPSSLRKARGFQSPCAVLRPRNPVNQLNINECLHVKA